MGKYHVILADPPWAYRNAGCRGCAADQYKTMSLADIRELPVPKLAADNCVLLLWCTWPQMVEGFALIKAWNFDYVTGFPWIKITDCYRSLWGEVEITVPYGVGFWARGTSEPLLIARKGSVPPPDKHFVGLLSPNLFHSRKPDSVYAYAEALPGPYLELFARRQRPGWDVWGNEAEDSIDMEAARANDHRA